MQDVLQEAMDLEGLLGVLRGIADGSIRCFAVDTPVPSQFAHELLNANPYAFLDEAGLEERRARAVSLEKGIPTSVMEKPGKLDQRAIDTVRSQIWPDIRDHNELHDLLMTLVALPLSKIRGENAAHWTEFFERLARDGRAQEIECGGTPCWVAVERIPFVRALWFDESVENVTKTEAMKKCVQGWMQILGPTTARIFAGMLSLDAQVIFQAFIEMEMQGLLMRGGFEKPVTTDEFEIEWCERRNLQRIHKLTVGIRRKQVEPVPPAAFMRWLLTWQHLTLETQLAGEEGLLEALAQLEGFEAPAIEWERNLLPARVAGYDPRWLDRLCLSGAVGWGRVSPHPAFIAGDRTGPRRVVPGSAAPITFYLRESAAWLEHALEQQCVEESLMRQTLTADALRAWELLTRRGACFVEDVQRALNLTLPQTRVALWELAAAGLAAADGFDQLRAMIDPARKSAAAATYRKVRCAAGRWSLFSAEITRPADALEKARRTDQGVESAARVLLARYGVLFRGLVARESNIPRWGVLLGMLRRFEDRGEVRGGRFVSGFGGEQFALHEAVDGLRTARDCHDQERITLSGADPMNLIGVVVPGERVPAVPGRSLVYRDGLVPGGDPEAKLPYHARSQRIRPAVAPARELRVTLRAESLHLF
jgi:ATP-dependent Lhr-like helicase